MEVNIKEYKIISTVKIIWMVWYLPQIGQMDKYIKLEALK